MFYISLAKSALLILFVVWGVSQDDEHMRELDEETKTKEQDSSN